MLRLIESGDIDADELTWRALWMQWLRHLARSGEQRLLCPSCDERLAPAADGTPACSACGGRWLHNSPIHHKLPTIGEQTEGAACPVCWRAMRSIHKQVLQLCERCDGVWLAAGPAHEDKALKHFYALLQRYGGKRGYRD